MVSTQSRPITSMVAGTSVAGTTPPLYSRNPARLDDVVAEVHLGTAETLVAACRAAHQYQPTWAVTPAPVRGGVIGALGRLVEANKEALARLVTREIGKPLAESRGEVQEVIDTCAFFLGEGRRLYGQTVPSELPDKHLFTFRAPVGVAVIVTAANFPVAVPSWYIVPALLCGNTVVWKPAEQSPAIADAFARIIANAGVPAGAFHVVQAGGASTFDGLATALAEGLVGKVGFTGSTEVGRSVGELCGRHLQSPCLELGGKNPMVVMPDADLDLAVEGALFSGFGTAGQRCTSLGTAFVHESVYREFLDRFAGAVRAAPIGDPTRDVLYGPLIDERYLVTLEGWLDRIAAHHETLGSDGMGRITSANPRTGFVGDPDQGVYAHPTIVAGVRPDDDLYRSETFGPLVGVAPFATLDEAIALANGPGYGLSAAIYTNAPASAFRFRQGCSAGMISVNNSTSGAEAHLPFGGNGKSGNGSRQSGMWVLDQFTRWQAMNWDFSGHLQKAQMDVAELPPADASFRLPTE